MVRRKATSLAHCYNFPRALPPRAAPVSPLCIKEGGRLGASARSMLNRVAATVPRDPAFDDPPVEYLKRVLIIANARAIGNLILCHIDIHNDACSPRFRHRRGIQAREPPEPPDPPDPPDGPWPPSGPLQRRDPGSTSSTTLAETAPTTATSSSSMTTTLSSTTTAPHSTIPTPNRAAGAPHHAHAFVHHRREREKERVLEIRGREEGEGEVERSRVTEGERE